MSYLSGIAMIFLVVIGGIFGLYMVISHANLSAPVDSFGGTTSASDNAVRNVTETSAPATLYMAGAIGLIVGFMVLISAGIYLVAAGKGNFRSRY